MIRDLVSPWLTAVSAADSARAQQGFRARHAALLESLRLARAPVLEVFPLATAIEPLHRFAGRAADPETQQLLRDAAGRAVALGANRCAMITMLAGDASGAAGEPLLHPEAQVVLFVEIAANTNELIVALAGAVAAMTRWSGSAPVVRDRWEAARTLPLREWIYTEGMGLHLAAALLPGLSPHQRLGINHAAFTRLREREKIFRTLLDADLDEHGIGLPLRWLTPDAPLGPRTVGDVVLPPAAGRYLAWRMTADRVERMGLREALRAES